MSERDAGDHDEARGWLYRGSFVAGWALIGFGVWTAFARAGAVRPLSLGTWFVGLTLLHDLVVAPAISAAAVVIAPRLAPRVRGAVLVAAIVSAVLVLISLPPLLGDPQGNATILPRNYLAGLAVSIVATWIVAAVWIVAAGRRPTRSR